MAIKIRNLDVKINDSHILKKFNLNVKNGEFVNIIGPNGSGKTTLLRAILNIVNSKSKKLEVFNKNIYKMSRKEISRNISYLPQIKKSFTSIDVRDFLLFSRFPYLGILSSYKEKDHEIINKIAREFEIKTLLNRNIKTLSGGELQRVLIASALVQETDVIFLDEPTTFLDPNHRWEIFNLLYEINKTGNKTIVLVTHFLDYILNYGDKVVALKEGHLFFDNKVSYITKNERLIQELYDFNIEIFENKNKIYVS